MPTQELLKKYADVLVKFALRSGEGVKAGDVVFVQLPECAKAFYLPLQESILEAGAHPIFEYFPDGVARSFFEKASMEQLVFYPEHYFRGKVDQMTHVISIVAENDKYELQGIDPAKIGARVKSRDPYKQLRMQKELEGKMTWTIAMFGTEAMAKDVGLTLEEYRGEIIKACYLDESDPVAQRKDTFTNIQIIQDKLNALQIEWVHVEGEDENLTIKIGADRKRLGGSGRNIPSFEIFTSPDRRHTHGWVKCNQPVFRYGQMVKDLYLRFENGEVVEFDASEGKDLWAEIMKIPGANRLGEFSLTDGRHSRITKFMGETLFDENVGGEQGNTHVAVGSAYVDTRNGDVSTLTKEAKSDLGFNDSPEHIDVVSTARRKVTATLVDGREIVIYENGQFLV